MPQGLGQGIRRSVMSAAQIIGPLWATLSGEDNGAYFWGGMVGLTGLCVIIILLGWKSLYFKMPKRGYEPKKEDVVASSTYNEDREDRPLLVSSRTSSLRSSDSSNYVSQHGSIN